MEVLVHESTETLWLNGKRVPPAAMVRSTSRVKNRRIEQNEIKERFARLLQVAIKSKRRAIGLNCPDDEENCCICLSKMKGHSVFIAPCGHYWHTRCERSLRRWRNATCPCCRQPFSRDLSWEREFEQHDEDTYRDEFHLVAHLIAHHMGFEFDEFGSQESEN